MKQTIIKTTVCLLTLTGLGLLLCESFAGPVAVGIAAWIYDNYVPDTEEV